MLQVSKSVVWFVTYRRPLQPTSVIFVARDCFYSTTIFWLEASKPFSNPGLNNPAFILHIAQALSHTDTRGPIRRGKSGGLAWKQGSMWENVNEFPKTKRWKYPQYTSEWGCVIMCKSNRPFIPANDYSKFISLGGPIILEMVTNKRLNFTLFIIK